ncbi:2-C-methyl-D-erythritol 4-phosphate cytidylyltransferase [compost metagenome]
MQTVNIVLAAGASSRMQKTKQLLLYNGKSLLENALECTIKSKADTTVCVLGAHAEGIIKKMLS